MAALVAVSFTLAVTVSVTDLVTSVLISSAVWENNLTGVLSSRYGKSYIGDNSRYTFLGWFSTGDPSFDYSTGGATSEFVGIAIDQVDKVIHCNASKFEIPGRIECGSLSVNGREI